MTKSGPNAFFRVASEIDVVFQRIQLVGYRAQASEVVTKDFPQPPETSVVKTFLSSPLPIVVQLIPKVIWQLEIYFGKAVDQTLDGGTLNLERLQDRISQVYRPSMMTAPSAKMTTR